jgi:glycosyltransferase involved in cell wall biosynthesis
MSYEIAVLVSTFERPKNLERCLASIERQRDVDGRFEVVVTDDGSRDDTLELTAAIARRVNFPLRTTTHNHDGFRLAHCRNEGAAASTAPYLLFTDGDCVLPPDHLRIHLDERRPDWVISSDCIRLDEEASGRVDIDMVRSGEVSALIPLSERWRIGRKAIRAKLYEWAHVSMRPRLTGNNIALWRRDFERVNGFDERFVGWGFEDRDLQDRLQRAGHRVRSILWHTATIHLWHAPDASFVRNGAGTANRHFFETSDRPVFCAEGLVKGRTGRVGASPSRPPMLVGGIS